VRNNHQEYLIRDLETYVNLSEMVLWRLKSWLVFLVL